MNFKRNILGVAVLSGTILIAGQALADGSLDAPLAVSGIPATAVLPGAVNTASVAGTVSWTAANAAVNDLNSKNTAALTDISNLAAKNTAIATAQAAITAAQALTAGNLIGGKTGAEIITANRTALGVNLTTGVYTAGTAGLFKDQADLVAAGVASQAALATSQATLATLSTGGISNSLIAGLQAAAEETLQNTANGTNAVGSTAGTLGKIAFDATAAIGTVRTNAANLASDATLLRKAADDAAAAVTAATAQIAANNNGTAVNVNAGSYQAGAVAGSDGTFEYDLADVTTAGKVIDIRDQTKQISWTLGTANNAAANTGTFAELIAAINANGMDYTAAVGGAATKIKLTATGTKDGEVVGAAAARIGATAAAAAAANGLASVNVAAVLAKAQNLTTFDLDLAELTLASTNANNALAVAIADAATKTAEFTAGVELKATYAASEAAYFTTAGESMATVAGVLNEDLARANAVTAGLEKTAAAAEAVTSADVADLAAAEATLVTATTAVTDAAAARDAARVAFIAENTTENSNAYTASLVTYNAAVTAQTTAQSAVDTANGVLYGAGKTAATLLAQQNGTNKTSVNARAAVVTAQATATSKENFLDMQVELAETGNPAGALQAGLMADEDSGLLVVTAVNSNHQATKTNAAGIAANVATLAVHEGLVTTNTANIATNTTNIATNTADIATNTADIATNTAGIATNTAGIATNAGNLQRVEMQMNENVDMLKSGIASALAIAGMPTAPGEGMGFSVGTGYFDGESAVAMGLTFVDGSRSYKLSLGHSGGETSASAGAAFKF